MIYITGDTHTHWISRLNSIAFPEQKEMTKNDYVIICGDFGIWNNSKREIFNLDWLENKRFTTLFISGNHENYDILDSLPVEQWHGGKVNFIRPSVIHLMRGQIFNIENKIFFTFGGASSHDIRDGILDLNDPEFKKKKKKLDKNMAFYRINHISWWERELPSKEEMEEGFKNLLKHNNKVDYIITHCTYTSLLKKIGNYALYQKDYLNDYLQTIKENVDYTHWFFGHMHHNKTYNEEFSTCLYEQIIKIL